jgi:hypothetical protein
MNTYTQGTVYTAGDLVQYNGKLYQKDNDNDQTAPDDVPGGWSLIPDDRNNLSQFNAIAQSFGSYEQRVQQHKAKVAADRKSAESKLEALGLTADELKALGL